MSAPTVPSCRCDACSCGRKPCPTPEACLLPEDDAAPFLRGPDGLVAVVCVAIFALVAAMEWACLLPGGCAP